MEAAAFLVHVTRFLGGERAVYFMILSGGYATWQSCSFFCVLFACVFLPPGHLSLSRPFF